MIRSGPSTEVVRDTRRLTYRQRRHNTPKIRDVLLVNLAPVASSVMVPSDVSRDNAASSNNSLLDKVYKRPSVVLNSRLILRLQSHVTHYYVTCIVPTPHSFQAESIGHILHTIRVLHVQAAATQVANLTPLRVGKNARMASDIVSVEVLRVQKSKIRWLHR